MEAIIVRSSKQVTESGNTSCLEKADQIVSSDEGKAALRQALGAAREFTLELQKARAVDPKKLNEPVTL